MYLKKSRRRGDFIMKSERLILRFEGENDIDLETLSNSLNSTVGALKRLAEDLTNENDYCKFKVLNIQKGSFVITIDQIVEYAPTILPLMPTVLETFRELLEIRNFLKGMPPKEITHTDNEVKIENNQGNVFTANSMTFNVYNNDVEKDMALIAKNVLNDKDRTGLTYEFIDEKGDKKIKLDRELLSCLAAPQDVEKFDKEIQENEMITYIKVRKPDLKGNTKWGCTLNGRNITCEICDEEFLGRVHNDEISFTSSTQLRVKMIIRYKAAFEPDRCEIISYKIVEVLKVEN